MDNEITIKISDNLFDNITDAIKEAIKEELPKLRDHFRKDWLSTEEVMELLHVSRRTLQNYRNEGKLSYTQFADNGKILYPREEIDAFLQEHMVERTQLDSSHSGLSVYNPHITND